MLKSQLIMISKTPPIATPQENLLMVTSNNNTNDTIIQNIVSKATPKVFQDSMTLFFSFSTPNVTTQTPPYANEQAGKGKTWRCGDEPSV